MLKRSISLLLISFILIPMLLTPFMINLDDYRHVEIFDHKTGNRVSVPFYKIKGQTEFVKTIYTNQGKDVYVKDDYPNIDKVRDHAFYQLIGMSSLPEPVTAGAPPPPAATGPYVPDETTDYYETESTGDYTDARADDNSYHEIAPFVTGTYANVSYTFDEVGSGTVYNETLFTQIDITIITKTGANGWTGDVDISIYNQTDSAWVLVSENNPIDHTETTDTVNITDYEAVQNYIFANGGWDIELRLECDLSGMLCTFDIEYVRIDYTYNANAEPSVDDAAELTNGEDVYEMYSRYRKYRFRTNVSDADGFADINYVEFRLTSPVFGTVSWRYDEDDSSWVENSNPTYIELVTGDCSNSSSGTTIELTSYVYIEWTCPDATDWEPTTYVCDTYGENDVGGGGGGAGAYETETDLDISGATVATDLSGTHDRGDISGTFYLYGLVVYQGTAYCPDDNGEDNVDTYVSCADCAGSPFSDLNGLSSGVFNVTCDADDVVGLDTYYIYFVNNGAGAGGTKLNATTDYDTYIADRIAVQVYMENTTHTGINQYIVFNVSLHYEYDNLDVEYGTVTMNGNSTSNLGNGWYELSYTRTSVYECTFNTIVVSADTYHGVTTVNQNSTSTSAIWDRIHIRLTNATHSIFALDQTHEYLTLASCYYEFCGTNLTLQWATANDYYTLNISTSYATAGWRWVGVATVCDTTNHSMTSFSDSTTLNIMWEDATETLDVTWTEESEALWYLICELTDLEFATYGTAVPDNATIYFADNSTTFATVLLLNGRATGVNSYTPAWNGVILYCRLTYVTGEYNFTSYVFYTNTYDVPAYDELYILEFEQVLEEDLHYVSYSTNWANTTITYYDNNTIQAATSYTAEGMDLEFTRSWVGGLHEISCYINGTVAGASGSYRWVNFSYYVDFVELTSFSLSIGENYIYASITPNKDATAYIYENESLVASGSILAEGTIISWLRNSTRGLILVGIYINVTSTDYIWLNSSYDNGIYASLAIEGWTFFLDGGWCHIQIDPTIDCTGYVYENDTLVSAVSPWTIDELGSNTYWEKSSSVGIMRVGIYLNTSGGSDIWLNTSYATSVSYDYMKIRIFNTKYELLPFYQFNVYINNTLTLFEEDYVRTDRVYNITVCDRYGTQLNSTEYSFDRHLDIIITVYLFKIYNYANTHYYLKITQNDTSYEWTDYIGPSTSRSFWLYDGQYSLFVYDWSATVIEFSYMWNTFHGEDKSVIITGTALDDLIDYINDIDEEIAELLGETMEDMTNATSRQGVMTWLFMIIFVFLAIIVGAVWSKRRGRERTAEEAVEETSGLRISQMSTNPYAKEEEELNKDLDDYGSEYY